MGENQKAAYIEMINMAMEECTDIALLDLVWKLLLKSKGRN